MTTNNKLQARIRYKINDRHEGYNIEIKLSDNEWGLDSFFPLVRRDGADTDEQKNFVHFSILNKIENLKLLGYEIAFC